MDPNVPPQAHLPGRPRRRPAFWLLVGVLLAVGAVGAGRALTPPDPLLAGPRTVEVPPQSGVRDIARTLADAGVIRSQIAFVALALARGTARSLKAGEYEVPQAASLLTTLELLETGKVKPHLLVLRDGFTIRELARQLDAEGLVPAARVLQAATSAELTRSLGIAADSLEGYLYPDTYQITKGMRLEDILARMVERFGQKIATPDVLGRARDQGISLHQLVTLASIVEKESGSRDELPIIAGVFWNRLKRDMLLQADPTVAYAVGKDGRAPTREDLQVNHPFNTYRYRGLPPGPIGSPSQAAVEAVLAPASVPYLYFVAIDDRHHHFSATLEEHNQAVARYRQTRRPNTP